MQACIFYAAAITGVDVDFTAPVKRKKHLFSHFSFYLFGALIIIIISKMIMLRTITIII